MIMIMKGVMYIMPETAEGKISEAGPAEDSWMT